jgi:hypothetical protein
MSTTPATPRTRAHPANELAVAGLLAPLLQRLEDSRQPVGADQYQSVVRHLGEQLRAHQDHPGLKALLDAYPAAAELYENLNYEHAGLCRSGLEISLNAELKARAALDKAARAA